MKLTKSDKALLGRFLNGEMKDEEIKSFTEAVVEFARDKKESLLEWLSKYIAKMEPGQCKKCSKLSELLKILNITCEVETEIHVIHVPSMSAIFDIMSQILRGDSKDEEDIGNAILDRIDRDQKTENLTEDIEKLISKMSDKERPKFVEYLNRKVARQKNDEKLVSFEQLLNMFDKK